MAPRDLFQQSQHLGRSPLAVIIGLLVDSAAVAGLMWLALLPAARRVFKHPERLTFLRATLPPVEVVESLRKARPLEIPRPQPPLDPETIVALRRLPEPAVPEPLAARPTVPEPLVVQRPVVNVGEFAAVAAPTPTVGRRQVQAVGFEAQPAAAPDIHARVAEVGVFESREIKDPRPGTDRPKTVEAAGFESAQIRSPDQRSGHTIADSGFGSASAAPQTQTAAGPQAVKPTGFSDAPPSPSATVRQKVQERVTPAEVLFKPTPSYSAEARAQKIEGTVTLEVEFSATGQVRVVRVIRGLGYGLDEMAIRAAEQIRFRPALSAGKPVDFTASVQIIFHLT
jgi:periplasmic protein TonB